jgi:hypothetical protein
MIDIHFTGGENYDTNLLGYRAVNFDQVDWPNSYIIQGCSAVFGYGIENDEETISACLSRKLKAPVINLGIGGGGVQLQYMNAVEMLEHNIRPKGVFMIWPNIHRFPLMQDGEIDNFGPWKTRGPTKKFVQWMALDNSKHHNLWHVRAYKMLWQLAHVPLYDLTHHDENKVFCNTVFTNFLDKGFDGEHWGPKTAEHIAEMFYQMHQSSQ